MNPYFTSSRILCLCIISCLFLTLSALLFLPAAASSLTDTDTIVFEYYALPQGISYSNGYSLSVNSSMLFINVNTFNPNSPTGNRYSGSTNATDYGIGNFVPYPYNGYSPLPPRTADVYKNGVKSTINLEIKKFTIHNTGTISEGVTSTIGWTGEVLDFIIDNLLPVVGLAVGMGLVGYGISKIFGLIRSV